MVLLLSFFYLCFSVITQCNNKEYSCLETDSDGVDYIRCIPRAWINDGVAHCGGGSDENITSLVCNKDEWSCDENTKCLSKNQV